VELTNTKKHTGYTSKLVYEKDGLRFSRGQSNQYNDNTGIINVSITLFESITIWVNLWEDASFYVAISKLLEAPTKNHTKLLKQTWKTIMALCNPKQVFKEVFETGRKQGQREKVEEMRKVLGVYSDSKY